MNELMRKDTEDSYELKELQNVILNIAAYVDKLCVEHDINYRLMGGSALEQNGMVDLFPGTMTSTYS